jgi:hypothetical protein
MQGAGRDLRALVETIQAMHHGEAMIHGLRGGLGLLVELMANIIEQRGFGEFGKGPMRPASEVE